MEAFLNDAPGAAGRKRSRTALVADLFCGAGSLSMGAHDALTDLGYSPKFVAVNHWPVAIDTYMRNHVGARAHCVTLDAAFPAQLVPEGRLDLLMAGIECTYFSRARGGKPVNDQQRMSAWHVVRWCTELRVKRVLLENVPEFVDWGPVDARSGKPIKSRKGEYFKAFNAAMAAIGLKLEWRVINCVNFGDATTRTRLFGMARSDGKPVVWPVPTHSKRADLFGSERWRVARDIIDWSIPGKSIFDRKKPLAPKTLARIAAGITKFNWPEPFIVVLRQHCDALGIDVPLPTITAGGTHLGLVQPFVLSQASGGAPRDVAEPLPTVPGGGAHALIAPYYGSGSGETCKSVNDPLPTATAKARFGLVMPVTHDGKGNRARPLDDPLPTITAAQRGELAFITASFGERPTQAPRVHSIDEPSPTICATGRTNLVQGVKEGRSHDILFRMLEPHELAAAMSISTPEAPYVFTGNKTEVVRQIGQAVPRRTGRALTKALMST